MKNLLIVLFSGLFAFAYGEVTITAVPGIDYKGSTLTVSGSGASTGTCTIDGQEYEGTQSGSDVVFDLDDLSADTVYDATIEIGGQTYVKRLYQGEAACTTNAWFTESATAPTPARWTDSTAPTVTDARFVFSADGETLVEKAYSPAAVQADRLSIVEMDVSFAGEMDTELPEMTNVKASICLAAGTGDNAGKYYFAYYKSGAWVTSAVEAEGDKVHTVRVSLDSMNETVRYEVKKFGEDAFTVIYDGASTSVTAKMTGVAFVGEGTLGTLVGKGNEDSAAAYVCQTSDDAKYKTISAAIADGKSTFNLLWDASWTAPDTASAYTFTGGRTLKILGGTIGNNVSLSAVSAVFAGGRYTATSKDYGTLASGCRWVDYVRETYAYQVVTGDAPIATDEKVYPVAGGGDVVFSQADLATRGIGVTSESSAADVLVALNTKAANGNLQWMNAVLGLSSTDASDKPIPLPVQGADADGVTFALGHVTVNPNTNAKVTYKVCRYDATKAIIDTSDSVDVDDEVTVALPASGVQYYKIVVDAIGAN